MNDLRNRGIGDILIAVVDGLKVPRRSTTSFPRRWMVQTCIVHLIRNLQTAPSPNQDSKSVAYVLFTADYRPWQRRGSGAFFHVLFRAHRPYLRMN